MDNRLFDPNARRVVTQWYCAFGKRPMVQVFVTADGVAESVRLAAKLDTVDGIEETLITAPLLVTGDGTTSVPPSALPASTEFNLIGELVVPASANVRPFCIGVICILTALWTQELLLKQLGKYKTNAEFLASVNFGG